MRALPALVFLAAACSAPRIPDAGPLDAGPGELDCPSYCYRGTDAGICHHGTVDSPCVYHCQCRFGETYDCDLVCPPIEPCRAGGWCGTGGGKQTSCGTDDAGCALECECTGFIIAYSWCTTRCGGGAPFQCFEQERGDGGCNAQFTCAFGSRACQCAPDAGWSCTG